MTISENAFPKGFYLCLVYFINYWTTYQFLAFVDNETHCSRRQDCRTKDVPLTGWLVCIYSKVLIHRQPNKVIREKQLLFAPCNVWVYDTAISGTLGENWTTDTYLQIFRQEREANHLLPCSFNVNNTWKCISTSLYVYVARGLKHSYIHLLLHTRTKKIIFLSRAVTLYTLFGRAVLLCSPVLVFTHLWCWQLTSAICNKLAMTINTSLSA
jgi:hypothetical protein